MQNTTHTITGQITYNNGLLLFSNGKVANPKLLVGAASIERFFEFFHHLKRKEISQNTNIQSIRYLYNDFCLKSILNQNGIDMCQAQSKGNFKFSAKNLKLVTAVSNVSRNLFAKVAGFLNPKK